MLQAQYNLEYYGSFLLYDSLFYIGRMENSHQATYAHICIDSCLYDEYICMVFGDK